VLTQPRVVRFGPQGLLGTTCQITAVAAAGSADIPQDALAQAEARIRRIEWQISLSSDSGSVSQFNLAPANKPVAAEPEALALLRLAQEMHRGTRGAFDPTVYPAALLWQQARKARRTPSDAELAAVMKHVGLERLKAGQSDLTKLVEGVQVDLGGIVHGFAADEAAAVLRPMKLGGALVRIGQEFHCFGRGEHGAAWEVGIQHPFSDRTCGTLRLTDAAVSSRGESSRQFEISGKRYSRLINPRNGRPVAELPGVTVICLGSPDHPPSAARTEAWATALHVLGPAGLDLLRKEGGYEALMITGSAGACQIHKTNGFDALLAPGTKLNLE
jgi:thiamine biosynthesis lipoprotein